MSEHPPQFSVKKLWIILLALTAAEVVYGEIGNRNFYEQKLLLWGGLLIFAYFKGYYIYQYFMHMKYEGAIVKGNVWFTVPLVIYFMIMLWPDTAANDKLNYEIAGGDRVQVEGRDHKGEIARREGTYDLKRFPVYREGYFGFRMVGTHHIYRNFRVYTLKPHD